jgi:hypothetical protein
MQYEAIRGHMRQCAFYICPMVYRAVSVLMYEAAQIIPQANIFRLGQVWLPLRQICFCLAACM